MPTEPSDPRPAAAPVAGEVAASRLVAACEAAWRALQAEQPDIPDAVIVLGTGMERGRLIKLGHWWTGQWVVNDHPRGEVLLAGEAFHLPAEAVFEVLVHEAAHGLNAARGIKDTSRGGRYHNARFKEIAEALGLTVGRADPHGWAQTELSPVGRERYASAIAVIAQELHLARHLPQPTRGTDRGDDHDSIGRGDGHQRQPAPRGSVECGCGRRMRMARSILALGPVSCGRCGTDFHAIRTAEQVPTGEPLRPAAGTVDYSFLQRRQRALDTEAGRLEPYGESLQHLEDFEAALVALSRDGDAEARRTLEVFRDRRADILEWIAAITTADVVALAPDRIDATREEIRASAPEPELDLRTVDLPLPTTTLPGITAFPPEPPAPELGA